MIIKEPLENVSYNVGRTGIFLAGGITNCPNWQEKTISCLDEILTSAGWKTDRLVVYNPRRKNFPMDDPDASTEQIKWEFKALELCDIFTMYFCKGISVQPICMYELGRNLVRMKQKFDDWQSRVVISVESGYQREIDVILQSKLAGAYVFTNATPETHAQAIAKTWCDIYR